MDRRSSVEARDLLDRARQVGRGDDQVAGAGGQARQRERSGIVGRGAHALLPGDAHLHAGNGAPPFVVNGSLDGRAAIQRHPRGDGGVGGVEGEPGDAGRKIAADEDRQVVRPRRYPGRVEGGLAVERIGTHLIGLDDDYRRIVDGGIGRRIPQENRGSGRRHLVVVGDHGPGRLGAARTDRRGPRDDRVARVAEAGVVLPVFQAAERHAPRRIRLLLVAARPGSGESSPRGVDLRPSALQRDLERQGSPRAIDEPQRRFSCREVHLEPGATAL